MNTEWKEREGPDVKTSGALISKLAQFTSTGLDRYPGAVPGSFVLAFSGMRNAIIDGARGVEIILCGGVSTFIQWPKDLSASGPVARTRIRPPGLVRGGDFKWRLAGGDVVEETCEIYALARLGGEPEPFCLPCKSSALPIAQKALSDAFRTRVKVGDREAAVIGGVWLLTSVLRKEGGKQWFVPAFMLKTLVGREGGPTPAELVKALDLRIAIQREEEAEKSEELRLIAQEKALAIEHNPAPPGRERGATTITSGLASLAERRPDLARNAPAGSPTRDPNDDINDIW